MDTRNVDVLIVGGGGAGISAAISASQNGAHVLIVEKMDCLGGSTGMSGAGIAATNTRFQRDSGIKDSKESWMKLWREREATSNPNGPYPDYDFVNFYMDEARLTTEWLVDHAGHNYQEIAGFGLDPVRRIHLAGKMGTLGGPKLIANLNATLKREKVDVMYNTAITNLIKNQSGGVSGILAIQNGKPIQINAQNVILATGGFAKNINLLKKYVPAAASAYTHSYSGAGNTGAGIMAAHDIGAALYEDPWVIGEGITTNVKGTWSLTMDWTKMYVNHLGQRFMNEETHYAVVTNKIIAEKDPWLVLDSSLQNKEIIEKLTMGLSSGEVVRADDVSALADKMQVPVANLVKTVAEYNHGAESGQDLMGKDAQYTVAIDQKPYYAVKIYPIIMGTFGGVKTNHQFQVLNNVGQVIPHLYATGESANKVIYNHVYMSGSSVQFALTSGRIAGADAAKNH